MKKYIFFFCFLFLSQSLAARFYKDSAQIYKDSAQLCKKVGINVYLVNNKFRLKIDFNTYTIPPSEKKLSRQEAQDYIYKTLKSGLIKICPSVASRPLIEEIAIRASKIAVINHFDKNPNQPTRTLSLEDNYFVKEYWAEEGEYIIYLSKDNMLPPAIILLQKNGNYTFDTLSIRESSIIQSNFHAIVGFINKNKEISIPEVVVSANSNYILIKRQNEGFDSIKITEGMKEKIKGEKIITNGKESEAGLFTLKEIPTDIKTDEKTDSEKKETKSSEKEKDKEAILVDNMSITCNPSLNFDISAYTYPQAESDSFNIIINTSKETKKNILSQKIGVEEFKRTLKTIFKDTCTDKKLDSSLAIFYTKLTAKLGNVKQKKESDEKINKVNAEIETIRKEFNDRIDNLADETDPAALLELRDTILLNRECNSDIQIQERISDQQFLLIVESVVLRVFNNNIHQLDVVGKINGKKVQTISNNQYGIGLRDLIDGRSLISVKDEYQNEYKLCYNQLFFVRPTAEDAISYTLQDGVYRFINKPDSNTQVLMQKRLLDFISASVFLDLQAFNEASPNKNLLTELYFNFNVRNKRNKFLGKNHNKTWVKYLYTNLTLAANLFKEPNPFTTFRKPELVHRDSIKIDSTTNKYDSVFTNSHYMKTFDLIKHSFFQIKPVLNLLSIDRKASNTLFDINAGFLLLGSNASFIDPERGKDSSLTKSVYSYAPLLETRFRITPKSRFGVDMHFIYSPGLNLLHQDIKPITGKYELETLVKSKMTNENKKSFIQSEINFFFNPKKTASNTDRGGVYFKLNMFKALKQKDGHFMFLVGYSTDIKNYLK